MSEMEEIIERCNATLDMAIENPKFIPAFVWKGCKGVAIINCTETGFVFSLTDGNGVVLKHNEDNTWGPPSAITYGGLGVGAIFGNAKKQVFLFPMTKNGAEMLAGKDTCKLGVKLGVTTGPGREVEGGMNHGTDGGDWTYSYVFSKGALVSIGVDGSDIGAANKINKEFYGKEAAATDIVATPDTVEIPKDKGVETMYEKLAVLSKEE